MIQIHSAFLSRTDPGSAPVGGHPDLPAGGQEEDLTTITERDRIR
jgi:hypothetical protein